MAQDLFQQRKCSGEVGRALVRAAELIEQLVTVEISREFTLRHI